MAGAVITGLGSLRRGLRLIDRGLPIELNKNLKAIAKLVAERTKTKIPRLTGRAAASVKPGAAGKTAYVKAGGANVVYYGWLEFGGTIAHHGPNHSHENFHGIKRERAPKGRYLYPTVDEMRLQIQQLADAAVDRVLRSAGF